MCFVDRIELYLIRVLTGDTGSYDVSSWAWHTLWSVKVNWGIAPWSFSIENTDVFNSMKGDSHRNLSQMKHRV